ncbi:F0F1 ATP synthase subunit delta, partial [bacterium]|nr:F0F1 ATP synthase subunit delta [bacterium]
ELDEVYKQRITEKLNTKLNKNIVADWQIDESIIGGLIVQIDDDVIDTSIKNKLENIQKIKGNL